MSFVDSNFFLSLITYKLLRILNSTLTTLVTPWCCLAPSYFFQVFLEGVFVFGRKRVGLLLFGTFVFGDSCWQILLSVFRVKAVHSIQRYKCNQVIISVHLETSGKFSFRNNCNHSIYLQGFRFYWTRKKPDEKMFEMSKSGRPWVKRGPSRPLCLMSWRHLDFTEGPRSNLVNLFSK